jgi:hypothetical protein
LTNKRLGNTLGYFFAQTDLVTLLPSSNRSRPIQFYC